MERPESSAADIANLILNASNSSKITKVGEDISRVKENQAKFVALQDETNTLTRELNELQELHNSYIQQSVDIQKNQIDLQKQQIELQRQTLLQQQIQNKRDQRLILERERQKEIKKTIFSINKRINEVINFQDRLLKYFTLKAIEKEINEVSLTPDLFEEISDKEYAYEVLRRLDTQISWATSELNENDKQEMHDLEIIKTEINDIQIQISKRKSDKICFANQEPINNLKAIYNAIQTINISIQDELDKLEIYKKNRKDSFVIITSVLGAILFLVLLAEQIQMVPVLAFLFLFLFFSFCIILILRGEKIRMYKLQHNKVASIQEEVAALRLKLNDTKSKLIGLPLDKIELTTDEIEKYLIETDKLVDKDVGDLKNKICQNEQKLSRVYEKHPGLELLKYESN
ncbi:MAG: hypothetical protein ACHQQQ_06280 [Bacteroidota bacterium]